MPTSLYSTTRFLINTCSWSSLHMDHVFKTQRQYGYFISFYLFCRFVSSERGYVQTAGKLDFFLQILYGEMLVHWGCTMFYFI